MKIKATPDSRLLVETLRFEDEFEIWLNVFSRILKRKHPRKLHCTLDSQALSGSQTDKLNLLTFDNSFPPLDYDIFAKTRSKMTTASIFSRQNDAGSQASTC